jgi:hypothetical protein
MRFGFAAILALGIGKRLKCDGSAIPLLPFPFHAQL